MPDLFYEARHKIEAMIFLSNGVVEKGDLVGFVHDEMELEIIMSDLIDFWKGRGINIVEKGNGWIMKVNDEIDQIISFSQKSKQLSSSAMATLSIIAIHQPVTIKDIESIRGVKISRTMLDSLVASGFVTLHERLAQTGRAGSYVTTEKFLKVMGLSSISDLPTPEEIFSLDLSKFT